MKRYWCKVNDEWVYELDKEDVLQTEQSTIEVAQELSEDGSDIDVVSIVAQPIGAGWGRQ